MLLLVENFHVSTKHVCAYTQLHTHIHTQTLIRHKTEVRDELSSPN